MADLGAFRTEVARLQALAASTEDRAAARVLGELDRFQGELRTVVTNYAGTPIGAQLAQLDIRLATVRATLADISGAAIGEAVNLGVELVDAPLSAAGLRPALLARGAVEDIVAQHTAATVAHMDQRVAMLKSRATAQFVRTADVADKLAAVGTQLRGSAVFGRPASEAVTALFDGMGQGLGAAQQRQLEAAVAAGAALGKRWVAKHRRTRRSHLAIDGTVVGARDPFYVGGHLALYPRADTLPPSERLRCRCRSVPTLEDQ